MQSELWSPAEWLSPSPEDAVKVRVRKRARALKVRRQVSPALVVLLLVVVGIQQLPTSQSSSSVRVGDEGGQAGSAEEEAAEATPGSSTTTTTARSAPNPLRDGVEAGAGPVGVTARSGGPPPELSARRRGEPLVTDIEGDSWDRDICEGRNCPPSLKQKVSQPALDLLSGDIRCSATAALLRVQVLDPDAPPQGTADHLRYTAGFGWDDGAPSSLQSETSGSWRYGAVSVDLTKSMSTNALTVSGRVTMYSDEFGTQFREHAIEDLRVMREGDTFVVAVSFAAVKAAADAIYPGRKPLARGSLITSPFVTARKDQATVDEMSASEPRRYTLCD